MFCPECGRNLDEDDNFCPSCGARSGPTGDGHSQPRCETCEIIDHAVRQGFWARTMRGMRVPVDGCVSGNPFVAKAIGPKGSYTAATSSEFSCRIAEDALPLAEDEAVLPTTPLWE